MARFEEELDGELSDCANLVIETRDLAEDYGRKLAETAENQPLTQTLLQFARLAVETPDTVMKLLRAGELAPCFVILRWHLEMSHLAFYLWQNPDEYARWLKGERIRPKEIGKFFESSGFHTWKDTYAEWSHVVHGNEPFVGHTNGTSCRAEKTEVLVVLVGNALVNLMWLTHKLNYVFGKYLIEERGTEVNELSTRYNAIQERIFEVTKKQHAFEDRVMNSDTD